MSTGTSAEQLAHEIRRLYRVDSVDAESQIEAFLLGSLNMLSIEAKLDVLHRLGDEFREKHTEILIGDDRDELLLKVFRLLLGRDISRDDLSSAEIIDRLAESINTLFDTINQLVEVINQTLLKEGTGDKTIRHVIGSHVEEGDQSQSLRGYLDQIRKAFLMTHDAFKIAATRKVEDILHELDPDTIVASCEGGLKFGSLRKAEYFEAYKERFGLCRKWFDSGRFMEMFLMEFEKQCQKLTTS